MENKVKINFFLYFILGEESPLIAAIK